MSNRPQHLASFENAYQVAIQRLEQEETPVYIVTTGKSIQPYRVCSSPAGNEVILAHMSNDQPSMDNLASL